MSLNPFLLSQNPLLDTRIPLNSIENSPHRKNTQKMKILQETFTYKSFVSKKKFQMKIPNKQIFSQ